MFRVSERFSVLLVIIIFFSISFSLYFIIDTWWLFSNYDFNTQRETTVSESTKPFGSDDNHSDKKESDFPFRELTIPYLRKRSYQSSIELIEETGSTSQYKSYLASYDSDGFTIYGQLTVPVGTQPSSGWPAVVFVHGYIPPNQYQTFSKYVAYVDTLAKNGLVVFKIDLRGHGKSEGEALGAYYSSDYIVDVLNAYAALGNEEYVNDQAIGLWGHSMAGNVVARTLAARPTIPAAVIWGGAVFTYDDLLKYRIQDNSYVRPEDSSERSRRRKELFDTVGEFDANNEFWAQVSPIVYLEDSTGSIQLHHAIDDTVVNIGYSRDFITLLDQYGVDAEIFEYQTGGHNISGASFTQAMQRTVLFF